MRDIFQERAEAIAANPNDPSHTHVDYPKMRCRTCRDSDCLAEEITDLLRDARREIIESLESAGEDLRAEEPVMAANILMFAAGLRSRYGIKESDDA